MTEPDRGKRSKLVRCPKHGRFYDSTRTQCPVCLAEAEAPGPPPQQSAPKQGLPRSVLVGIVGVIVLAFAGPKLVSVVRGALKPKPSSARSDSAAASRYGSRDPIAERLLRGDSLVLAPAPTRAPLPQPARPGTPTTRAAAWGTSPGVTPEQGLAYLNSRGPGQPGGTGLPSRSGASPSIGNAARDRLGYPAPGARPEPTEDDRRLLVAARSFAQQLQTLVAEADRMSGDAPYADNRFAREPPSFDGWLSRVRALGRERAELTASAARASGASARLRDHVQRLGQAYERLPGIADRGLDFHQQRQRIDEAKAQVTSAWLSLGTFTF